MPEAEHAREVVAAFCALEPADAWAAFRAIAADRRQPEDMRVRAAAWLAIANAVGSLQEADDAARDPDADA